MKMIKARNILISPIKAVLSELDDNTADYILCSSEIDGIENLGGSNVLGLEFLDTEMPDHFMRFTGIHAGKIRAFLTRPDANEDLFVCCDSGESSGEFVNSETGEDIEWTYDVEKGDLISVIKALDPSFEE